MSSLSSFEHRRSVLPDPWETAPLPLNGILERHQFGPLFTALAALFLVFILFQLIISPIAVVLLVLMQGVPASELLDVFANRISEYGSTLLIGNTIGQVLGMLVPAFIFARMHSSRERAFLRLRRSDLVIVGLGVVGLAGLMPLVQWLAAVNQSVPLPEWLRELEQSQTDLIEKVLMQDDVNLVFNLVVLALTPAFCEEILFRGYFQRQTERSLGFIGGIVVSGLAFGLYHLRLSQLLPLATLGLYLAYLAWRTGSLWPSIVAHFVNNAFAVALGAYAATHSELDVAKIEQMEVPWYLIIVGLVFFGLAVYELRRRAHEALIRRAGEREPEVEATEPDEESYGRPTL